VLADGLDAGLVLPRRHVAGHRVVDRRRVGGGQLGHPGRGGPGERGGHRVEAADRVGVGLGGAGEGVGDQQHGGVVVVQHGQVGHQRHRQLGHAQVVHGGLGQPLQPPDDVVAQVADQPAGQRGQPGRAGGAQPAGQRPDGGQRVGRQVVGEPGQRVAQPQRGAVPLGEHPGAGDADEAVPRPLLALLGGLQQHGARPVAGELAVDADRGLGVGQQPPGDREDGALAELVERGRLTQLHGTPPAR
jgi:hypothetical protein